MANVTVDIQARVVGYEQSIKSLQAALAKVDPGSDIGKSITKAMEQAQSQVKALSKNMFPKASSDTQIDAIIEKTNRAGEAIQQVASLLQNVQVSDLNLGAFGGDIENFKNQLSSLQTELDSKLNAGIIKAVGESEQLKNVFKELGTDLSKATGATLLEDLSKGAQKAAENVTDLEKKLEKAQTLINSYQTIDSTLKSSRLGTLEGRTALDDELKTITGNYDAVFEQLRATMTSGFSKLKTDTKLDTDGLLKTFFSDLTPENIQSHVQNLFNTLSSQGVFGENEKRKFYESIFGGNNEYNTNNINSLTKSIGLDKAYEQYKAQLQEFYKKIANDIDGKDQAQINRLISTDQLDKAVNATTKALDNAYSKIYNSIKQNQERLNSALSDKDNIVLQLNTARQTQNTFSSAEQSLRQEIEAVRQENKNLENQIVQLREQLNQKLSGEAGNIRNVGTAENHNVRQGLRESIEMSAAYKNQLEQVAAKEQALGKLQGVVQRWFSIYAAIRMVRQAVNSVISTVKELDKTITEIAIVTSMDQSELWDQMPKYTQLARDYAASISGVYQVSQLYYQQGLQTADVMALTEQTLKMARISGLDYAQATDYMTNAVRSFKMEMTDASTVVDVYSAIAASSATSVTELASAMSKTASSAEAVGSSFQNTTAMMAVMIEATRESAENIGSAMKSIISRYGEMTSDPSKLVDSEGQEMSLNRVDKALQTVGISIHNAEGEFRNFDEVIMELAEKWNTIDTNTQRYIATIMAGNRQQSRFLALVSSYDRLKELSAKAAESEDASQLQFLKTLDSVEAKTQQFQTSIQALYVNSGLEDFYKTILDWANKTITSLDQLSDKFGLLASVGKISSVFTTLAALVSNLFNTVKVHFSTARAKIMAESKVAAAQAVADETEATIKKGQLYQQDTDTYIRLSRTKRREMREAAQEGIRAANEEAEAQRKLQKEMSKRTRLSKVGMGASALGLAATTWAASTDVNENRGLKAGLTAAGGVLSGVGTGLMIGGAPGAIIGALTALPSILEAIGMASESTAERLSKLQKAITDTNNTKLEARSQLKTLADYKAKFDELSTAQFESAEAKEQFLKLQNDIAASYPELISGMDAEGNYIVNMTDAYKELAAAKAAAYKDSFISNLGAELAGLNDLSYVVKNTYGKEPLKASGMNWLEAIGGKLPSGGKSQIQDYIIDMASGKDHDLNVLTLRDLITNGRADSFIRSVTTQTGNTSGFGPTSVTMEGISPENIQIINEVVGELAKLAKGDNPLTFREAQAQLSKEYEGQEDYQRAINNIDEKVGQYLFTVARAADFQDVLVKSKINSSNAEYMKILQTEAEALGDSRFVANDLQQYGMQQQLNTDLKAYLDANRYRIENKEKYKDANNKDQFVDEKRLIEEFYTGLNGQSAKDLTYYNEQLQQLMLDGINDQANEIYKDLGKYSKNYIRNSGVSKDAQNLLLQALGEQYKNIFTDYANWISNTDFHDEKIKTSLEKYSDSFSVETLQAIQKQYSGILNNDFLSDNQRNTQLSNLTEIYDEIAKISDEDYTTGQTLLAAVQKADLTSLQGINSTIEAIGQLNLGPLGDTLLELLRGIKKNLTVNLTTEFTQLGEKLTNNMSDFEKAISNSTKGMDLKTATEMAEKLGKGLGDFQFLNGKFYYDNYEDIENAYLDADQALIDDLKKRKDLIISANKQLDFPQIETEIFNIEELDSSMGIDEDYLSRWASKFEELGLSVSDVLNYALGNFDETIMTDEDLDKLKNLEMPTLTSMSLPIDQLIESTNNIEDIFSVIDAYDFSNIEGLNAGSLKNYVTLFMNRTGEDLGLSFSAWLEKYLNDLYESNITKINEYKTYQTASTYLLTGDIEHFLSTAGVAFSENLKNQIISGDISNLPQQLQQFATLIYDTYHSINESIANSMISAISDGEGLIKVTDTNKAALEKIQSEHANWLSGNITVGSQVTISAQSLLENAQAFEQFIVNSFDTDSQRIKALTDAHNNQYKNSSIGSFNKVLTTENFAYEDLLNYLVNTKNVDLTQHVADIPAYMNAMGLAFNSVGEVIVANYTAWIQDLEWTANMLKNNPNASREEKNAIQAKLDTARHAQEQAIASGFDDILKDYSNISIESIEALANALGVSYEYILSYLTSNGNGTYQLDISKLSTLLSTIKDEVSQATAEAIEKSISSIGDTYLSNIKNATSYTTKGASSLANVETFRQSYADIVGKTLSDDAFSYNSVLQSFVLDESYMDEYINAQREKLRQLNYSEEFIEQYIKDQTDRAIQDSIALDGFLNATTSTERNDEANKLFQQIKGLSKYQEISRSAIKMLYPEYGMGLQAAMADIEEESFKAIMTVLESGGQDAVDLLKQIKPNASADELSSVYSNAINRLNDALADAGEFIEGSMINTTSKLYQILKTINPAGVNADGVITASYDMVEVYARIYAEMSQTAGATTAGLNEAYVKLLTAQDQENVDIIDILSNASGMTYDAFAAILTRYGISLQSVLENAEDYGVIRTGYGKIAVTNFNKFQEKLGQYFNGVIDKTSQEYLDAYSSYVDSQVSSINQSQTNLNSAFEQIKSITEAKDGEALNVAYVEAAFDAKGQKETLATIAARYGAVLKDGLLQLTDFTNIPGLVNAIGQKAQKAGILIPEQLGELSDAISDMLNQITSLIRNGIEGNLSNAGVAQLQQWATKQNIGDLDFNETADGLKLTAKSMADVYVGMKSIDKLQAQSLLSDIMDTKDSYQSLTGALMEFNDAQKSTNGTLDHTSELLQDVVSKNLTSADSMNFMSNSLPEGMQTAVNAWENASGAINALTTGQKKGYMGVQDFYNVVTTASSLLEAAGQDFSIKGMNAAQLIELAGSNLKVVGGKLQVDLSASGMDITGSIGDLKSQMTDGIQELAKSEIEMLDAEIQVLEVLAAMEKLGDVDVNGNGINFELEDLFEIDSNGNEVFTKEFQDYLDDLKSVADTMPQVEAALKSIKVGAKTLYELVESKDWAQWKEAGFTKESLSQFLQTLTTMDWDIDNIQSQVADVLSGLKIGISVQLEDGLYVFTVTGKTFTFDWSDEDQMKQAQAALDEFYNGKYKDTQAGIEDLVAQYTTGKNSSGQELSWEERCRINTTLAVASGSITVKKAQDGSFYGYYKNKKVTGTSETDVKNKIGQAMSYEDEGYTFTVAENGDIQGELKVGKTSIQITHNEKGETVYHATNAKNQHYDGTDKNEALGCIAAGGEGEQGTYKFEGQTYSVFVDAATQLTYSVYTDNGKTHYVANGQTFDDPKELQEYLLFQQDTQGGLRDTESKENFEIVTIGDATITYDLKNHTVEYFYNGTKFASREEYLEYIAAYEKAGGVINANNHVEYTVSGCTIETVVDETGHTSYHVSFMVNGQMAEFTADDEAGLEAGIAAVAAITGEKTIDGAGLGSAKFTINNATFTVTMGENGELISDDATGDIKEKLQAYNDQLQKQVDQNGPLELQASSINVTLADGGTVQVGSIESPTIPEMTVNVTTLHVNPQNVDTGNEIPTTAPPIDTSNAETQSAEGGEKVGEGLGDGAIKGMQQKEGDVKNEGELVGKSAVDGTKIGSAVSSPSKLTIEVGNYIGEGLIKGLQDKQSLIVTAGTAIGTAVIEAINTAVTEGMTTLSEGIAEAVESVDKSYTELETKTEQVAGSIRSHWDALVNQITAAVSLIQSLVQSLQEKISITWTIGSEGGKSDLAGFGSGTGIDPNREMTALTEYMDKMLSTMEHNKEKDTFKVTMPALTIDTSTTQINIDDIGKKVQEEATKKPVEEVKVSVGTITADLAKVNVDVASINEKVKTEVKANPISSLDVSINSITPDLTGTTVDTAGINTKVQADVTKNPISNLNVAVSTITPDATGANIDESGISEAVATKEVTVDSIKAVPSKIDASDLTKIDRNLGSQTAPTDAKMTISNPIKAVPSKIQLDTKDFDWSTGLASEELNTEGMQPIKIPAEVDIKQAETDIATLKTKIGEIKQESKPKILVDINPAIIVLNALHKAIAEVKQKKAPQITVDTEVAKTNLNEIIDILNTIIEKAQSLMIRITTAQETYQTSEFIKTIMNNLLIIEEKKTQTITISGGNWQKLISDLNDIASALERIQGASGINIDVNGGPEETPEGGETSKEGETSQGNQSTTTTTEVSQQAKVTTPGGTEIEMNAKVVATEVDGSQAPAMEMPVEAESVAAGANIEKVSVPAEAESVDVPSGTTVAIQASIDVGEAGQSLSLTATYTVTTTGDIPADKPNLKATYIGVNGGGYIPGDITAYVTYIGRKGGGYTPNTTQVINATGNVGLAKAQGTQTLMGELGPELVVSNGRYFVVGQNGAEMVNLDKDAIVFNHLQTEQLLKNGMSKERGRAVTNERNAVAFAKGNISGGPAMASASAALAVLKQIRSMWQSLLNASVKDLAGAGGSGGGGGGGDKGKGGKDSGNKSFIEDVERWYNLMQEIAKLEKVINHEETLRAKLEGDLHKNGSAYYKSQKESLAAIQNEIKAQEELNISRREYFNQRRKQLNQDNGPFSQLYEFDPQGQLKYKDNTTIKGSKATNGYAFLADLMAQDPNTGKPKYTVEQQYKILKKAGFAKYMKYDSSGNEIKLGGTDSDDGPSKDDYNTYYSSMVQAFWDRVEAQKSEMQTLYDSVAEGENSLLEKEQARNELLEAMYDNQKELENSVLNAIEDMKQREIDALQDERDKLEEATGKYIEGLSDALDKERQMYDTQENQNELDTKKRRLGILQRSGASAEDIYSLQKEITESEKNMYFDAQQAQIDAIQQASDLEIERLDTQIQIMQDTLDFQKEMGLLWYQVYDVMGKSSAEITQFIMGNDSQFWNKSPLESAQTYEKTLFEADQWKSFATDTQNFIQWTRDSQTADALSTYSQTMGEQHKKDDFWKNNKERYESEFTRVFEDTGDRTKAATAASKMFETDKAWNDRETTAGDRFVSDKETEYVDLNDTYHWVYTYEKEKYTGLNEKYKDQEQLYFKSREKEKHVWGSDGLCTKCGHKKPKKKKTSSGGGGGDSSFIPPYGCGQSCAQYCKGKLSGGTSSSKSSSSTKKSSTTIPSNTVESIKEPATSTKKNTSLGNYQSVYTQDDKKKTKGQASGGYVGHGIYELGERGTETVLTAQQTRVLRNNILSNKPSSLVSLLKTYNEGFSMNQRYGLLKSIGERMSSTTNNTSGGITIENATVNMNVQKIANDYDAKRAGEQALNEMLRIANKTSAANNIRR